MSKNVFIAGVDTFIGQHTAKVFVSHGYRVYGASDNDEILKILQKAYKKNFVSIFTSPSGLKTNTKDIHEQFESVVYTWLKNSPSDRKLSNYGHEDLQNVLNFAKSHTKRFIFVSDANVNLSLGDQRNLQPIAGILPEGLSKYLKEALKCEKDIYTLDSMVTFIVRPENPVGYGVDGFIQRIVNMHNHDGIPLFNNGENIIEFTPIEDVSNAIIAASVVKAKNNTIVNISNNEDLPFKKVIEILFTAMGIEPKFQKRHEKGFGSMVNVLNKLYEKVLPEFDPIISEQDILQFKTQQHFDMTAAENSLQIKFTGSLEKSLQETGKLYKKSATQVSEPEGTSVNPAS